MEDDLAAQELAEQLEKLALALKELEKASRKALGFIETVEYEGIPFNVSRRFVIADLSPLAFFHLIEYIEDEGAMAAIARLYERLNPLLTCRHDWTALRRAEDDRMRVIVGSTGKGGTANGGTANGGVGPYICKECTAYALGPPLPVVGRKLVERKAAPPRQ